MKTLLEILSNDRAHWVGDGFPVRSLFSYHGDTAALSPFLLFDHAGPWRFPPAHGAPPRGVGQHPHRGFETVTIVYDGEVSHRDSSGGGGTIGAGEVQWMTAGAGIVHEEYHSPAFASAGGLFHVVQLWINLRAQDKRTPARYQAITREMIPDVGLAGGTARIIAGDFRGTLGPATTFTPINLWDVRLEAGADELLPLPAGHTSMIAVLAGAVTIAGAEGQDGQRVGAAGIARFAREGEGVRVRADEAAVLLVLTGAPIAEPVVGHGPFVMNTQAEISEAIADFAAGRFGTVAA